MYVDLKHRNHGGKRPIAMEDMFAVVGAQIVNCVLDQLSRETWQPRVGLGTRYVSMSLDRIRIRG